MKRTKYLLIYTAILVFLSSFYGCERENYEDLLEETVTGSIALKSSFLENANNIVVNFDDKISTKNIKVESSFKNSILKSTLFYKNGSNWIDVNSFEIDMSDPEYRKKMTFFVKEKAEKLKDKFDLSELISISNMLEATPELLFEKLGRKDFYKESPQAMFYHLGAINSARRALLEKSEECECSIDIANITNKTPFNCLEDKFVSTEVALKVVAEYYRPAESGVDFKPEKTLNYLKSNLGKSMSVSKLNYLLLADLKHFWDSKLTEEDRKMAMAKYSTAKSQGAGALAQNEDEACDQISEYARGGATTSSMSWYCASKGIITGMSCGCCGNYFGPCKCCAAICMIHDLLCIDCGWGCGPDCRPGCP